MKKPKSNRQLFRKELDDIKAWRVSGKRDLETKKLVNKLEKALLQYGNPRKFTYNGVTNTLAGWSKVCGVPARLLNTRLAKGWTVKRAIETKYISTPPVYTIKYKGRTLTLAEWEGETGISRDVIRARYVHNNWSAHNTLTTPVRRQSAHAYKDKDKDDFR